MFILYWLNSVKLPLVTENFEPISSLYEVNNNPPIFFPLTLCKLIPLFF